MSDCKVISIDGRPIWITCCGNVEGYCRRGGKIVKSSTNDLTEPPPLPNKPMLFASYHKDDEKHCLLVTSLDGCIRLECRCEGVDWTGWIRGLVCDSKRQTLYVAQPSKIVVTDLSGELIHTIEFPDCFVTGIDANERFLFALCSQRRLISVWNKDSFERVCEIDVSSFTRANQETQLVTGGSLTLMNNRLSILLARNSNDGSESVIEICLLKKEIINKFPNENSDFDAFRYPADVSVDNASNVYISEHSNHCVRIMTSDGSCRCTLGNPAQPGCDDFSLKSPCGLVTVQMGQFNLLAVADFGNERIALWDLNEILP